MTKEAVQLNLVLSWNEAMNLPDTELGIAHSALFSDILKLHQETMKKVN